MEELTVEQKEQLLQRITDLLDTGVLKSQDWCAMYDLMRAACEREKAVTMEDYLISCMEGDDAE